MSLSEAVQEKLAEWRPTAGERRPLAITDGASGWTIALTAERNDEVASLLWEVELRNTNPLAPDLASFATMIAEHATSSLEAMKVLEVDAARSEAIVRTSQPSKHKDAVRYYEVLVSGTTALTLRRFRGFIEEPKKREQIAFPLTHEALSAVISNLTAP